MNNSFNTPNNSFQNKQSKVKKPNPQIEKILEELHKKPSTIFMLFIEILTSESSIKYHISKLIEQGKVKYLKRDYCRITKHKASYYAIATEFIDEPSNTIKL